MRLPICFFIFNCLIYSFTYAADAELSSTHAEKPLPSICQIEPIVTLGGTNRKIYFSNFDPIACKYLTSNADKTLEQVEMECKNFFLQSSYYPGEGTFRCLNVTPLPHIPVHVGCYPASIPKVITKLYSAQYTLSKNEYNRDQCLKIKDCLQNDLQDPDEIASAQNWFNVLKCEI